MDIRYVNFQILLVESNSLYYFLIGDKSKDVCEVPSTTNHEKEWFPDDILWRTGKIGQLSAL